MLDSSTVSSTTKTKTTVMVKPSLLLPEQLDRTLMTVLEASGLASCKDTFEMFKDCVLEQVRELSQKFSTELYGDK